VKLQYENHTLEAYFDDLELMQKKIGKELTRNIKKRCDQLIAAANFSIYLATGLGKPHPLVADLEGYWSISISANMRLIVKPVAESSDPASFKNCEAVIVKGVMDYHSQKQEWLIP